METSYPLSPQDEAERRTFRHRWLRGIRAEDFREIVAGFATNNTLSDEQVGSMLVIYVFEEWDREPEGRGDAQRLRGFLSQVGQIRVEVERGGRAVLRDPDVTASYSARRLPVGVGPSYRVEISFEQAGRDKHPEPKQMRVIGDQLLGWWNPPDLRRYAAALLLRLGAKEYEELGAAAPPTMPTAGQAPKMAFYRWLLGREEQLLRAGEPAPARTIAEQLDRNENTVRSWLKRAREYVKEGAR